MMCVNYRHVLCVLLLIAGVSMNLGCKKHDDKIAESNDSKASASNSGKNKTFEILIDWTAEPTYIGVYYAKSLGLYERLGLEVKIIQGRGANQAVAAVAAGTYPMATASGGATVLGRNSGMQLISLGVLYSRPSTVIYGLATSGIAKPKDLVGKTIGIYPGSITRNEFDAFSKLTQLDPKQFKIVSLSGPDIPLLKAGRVDAVLQYSEMSPVLLNLDPSVTSVNGTRVFEIYVADYGVDSYSLNVVTSRAAYQRDGDRLTKVAAAIFEGYRKACEEPERAAGAFQKEFPQMDPAYVRESLGKVCKAINGNYGTQTADGWQRTIDMYKSLHLLTVDVTPKDLMP